MKKIFAILVIVSLLLLATVAMVSAKSSRSDVIPESVDLKPELLISLSGVVLSLLFSYIPGLRVKFAELQPDIKRLIMLGLVIVVAGTIFGLGCASIIKIGLGCDRSGIQQLVWYILLAMVANQSAYQITPLPSDVKDAKA